MQIVIKCAGCISLQARSSAARLRLARAAQPQRQRREIGAALSGALRFGNP